MNNNGTEQYDLGECGEELGGCLVPERRVPGVAGYSRVPAAFQIGYSVLYT